MSEEREDRWSVGDRVNWGGYAGPGNNGVVVQVAFSSVTVRWETGWETIIAAASPWLKKVGRA